MINHSHTETRSQRRVTLSKHPRNIALGNSTASSHRGCRSVPSLHKVFATLGAKGTENQENLCRSSLPLSISPLREESEHLYIHCTLTFVKHPPKRLIFKFPGPSNLTLITIQLSRSNWLEICQSLCLTAEALGLLHVCFHLGSYWLLTCDFQITSDPQTVCRTLFKSNFHSLASVGMTWITVHWSNKFGNLKPLFVLRICWQTCSYHPSNSSSWPQVGKGKRLSNAFVLPYPWKPLFLKGKTMTL